MPTRGAATPNVSEILQKNYLPGIIEQFNKDYPLLRYIRQNSGAVNAEGDKAVIALEIGVNEGGGFHGESADVPDSGHVQTRRTEVTLKQMTFRARLTYKLMRKAKTRAASFARGAQQQMTGTREGFTMTASCYLWGDGTGVMARVHSETIGANRRLVLNRAYGLEEGGAPEQTIRIGQKIHILDTRTFVSGVTADRGTAYVQAVDYDDPDHLGRIVVTVAAEGNELTGVAADDYVFLQNSIEGWVDPDEEEDNRPAMGMIGFYDHTIRPELQGIDADEDPWWKASLLTANRPRVVQFMRRAKNRASKRSKRGGIAFAISSYESHERYASELDPKVEFRNVRSIDGLWDVATIDGKPWFLDHTAPDGRVFFVPKGRRIERYAVDDFINFVNFDTGGPLHRVPNKTVADAMLSAIYEYGIKRRNDLVSVGGMTWDPLEEPS